MNEKKKPYQYISIRTDITERKLNEEKIVESERFLKTITENIPAMITYWDAGLYCRFANQASLVWFDKTEPELLGAHKIELLGQEEFAQFEKHINGVLGGNAQRFEHEFHKDSDKHIFADIQYLPDRSSGLTKGFYSLIYDITELKQAELAKKLALEERNNILKSIDDGFFAVDNNWKVTYWNNMAEKLLQTPVANIIGRRLWEVFPDTVGLLSYQKYHEAVATKQAVRFEDHYPALQVWYEISAYPSNNGLSVYFKDITSRKTSESLLMDLSLSLQQYTKDLAKSNADLEQFAYVASHDLQEPLRMITSFLTLLERKYGNKLGDTGKQYLHFAVDGAKRMRQIILDLLEFSRVGSYNNKLEEIDLNQLVEEILVLYRTQIKEKNAEIRYEKLPRVSSHRIPLRQVLQNLIGNALKYQKNQQSPLVKISSKEVNNHWVISVQDNGIGIAAQYYEKIFAIFQRLHNKDEYTGTGIGLAITKKIVENLGGKIWVSSELGKGSTFYFTILKK